MFKDGWQHQQLGIPGPGFGSLSSWLVLGGGRGRAAGQPALGLENEPGELAVVADAGPADEPLRPVGTAGSPIPRQVLSTCHYGFGKSCPFYIPKMN